MAKKFIYVNNDGLYEEENSFEQADHVDTSTGAADAGKPIILDADGQVDASMINSADVDHNQTTNYDINEHRVINDSGTATTELWSANKINSEITRIDTIFEDQKDPTGFVDRLQSTLSFTNATRTFNIDRVSASYDIYSAGEKTTITTDNSITISTAIGSHYIYYDGNTLQETTTFTSDLIEGDLVYVAVVYWNGVEGFLLDERHGLMDKAVHAYLHNTRGTAYQEGFDISGFVLDSDVDADVTFGLTNGIIRDEDIVVDVVHAASPANNFEQVLADPSQIPVFYRSGATGVWVKDAATDYAFKNGASLVAYNEDTGSTWQQSELNSGEFTEVWIFATSFVDAPIVAVQGIEKFASETALNTDVASRISAVTSEGLPFVEFKLLYRIGLETDSAFTNTRKAKIVKIDDFRENAELGGSAGSVVTDHGSLSGLTDLDHPASAIISDTSSYNGRLSAADTTVQLALNTLDDHVHDDRYYTETELDAGQLDNRYYTETELDAGQLDNRYFTEAEHIDSSAGVADAGKPIILDADGKLDPSFIDEADLDHNSLNNLTVGDPHTQYVKKAGDTMSGNLDMGGNEVVGLPTTPTAANAATSKAYVDAVATGLRPKGNVAVATTADITLSGLQTIDGYLTVAGDRVLVKDQSDQTENGIYIADSGAWSRSLDQDNNPLAEIVNGVFIPQVLNGTLNVDKPFFISSVGTGTDGLHQIGIDDIIFEVFTSPTQLSAGDGISIAANVVSVDLAANSGLEFNSGQLSIDDASAGEGLSFTSGVFDVNVDDSTIEISTDTLQVKDGGITDNKLALDYIQTTEVDDDTIEFVGNELRVKADGIDDTHIDFGIGANQVNADDMPIIDAGGFTSETTVEGSLQELYGLIATNGVIYTVGTGGVTKGDLVYISANDTVLPYSVLTQVHRGIGVALTTESAASSVKVLANDTVLTGVLTGATSGDPIYWNGSSLVTSIPSGSGSHVWQVGIAKNATDLHVEVRFIKKNL